MRTTILTILSAFLLNVGTAQNLYVKVGETYKVTAADQKKRVQDKYAAGQDTLPTGLYYAWQRWKVEGMPYATFRTRYIGAAIAKDIAWRYEWSGNIKSGFQNVYAFADWTDASGHWYSNVTMPLPRAGMKGVSSFGHYDDTNTSQIFASLEFEMDDADWWPANQTERRLFETPNSGLSGENFYSYNEAFTVENVHLTGPAKYGDGINRIGLFLRRPGECSYIHQINASMFQQGIVIQGATPIDIGTITVFWNEKIGVAFTGSWGATVQADVISGDSNGELVGIHPGYTEEAGGVIDIDLLKNEDGILPENPSAPWRGQIALYAEGQYSINVDVVNNSRNSITTDAAFVVNPRLTNGSPQNSILRVGPHKGYNYKTTLQNLATGTRWEAHASYSARTFTHYAQGNRMVIDDQVTPGTVCNCPPLGFFRGTGTFDYVNCTPARAGTTTPPPSGSWSCTSWSACVNGSQTRTCTCSGTCTDPKPAESQACTVTPPTGTMTATASLNNVTAELAKITDGNANTFWIAGASMASGQWVQVDYGTTASRSSVAFDIAVGYLNSYPRTYDVQTSTDGASWQTVKSGVAGAYPTCSTTFTATSCRYIRVVCKAANSNWWAIAGWR